MMANDLFYNPGHATDAAMVWLEAHVLPGAEREEGGGRREEGGEKREERRGRRDHYFQLILMPGSRFDNERENEYKDDCQQDKDLPPAPLVHYLAAY